MTVVYTVGTGSRWQNNELRYSIRSMVKYTAVNRIIVVGFKPDWLTGVEHIPYPDGPRKQLNIHLKTLAACDVCSDFIQAADDHFVLAPTDFTTFYYCGYLKDKKYYQGRYAVALHNTRLAMLEGRYGNPAEPLAGRFFNVHIPMHFESYAYKLIVTRYDWHNKDFLIKSLYGNYVNINAIEPIPTDVKVTRFMRRDAIDKFIADKAFLSVSDAGLSVDMRRFLAERFPDPSKYECG